MDALYENAGARIKRIREKRGYSREELAEKAEISAKFLYEIEMGKKGFSAGTLYRISKVLTTNCDYILKGDMDSSSFNSEEMEILLEMFGNKRKEKLKELLRVVYSMVKDE